MNEFEYKALKQKFAKDNVLIFLTENNNVGALFKYRGHTFNICSDWYDVSRPNKKNDFSKIIFNFEKSIDRTKLEFHQLCDQDTNFLSPEELDQHFEDFTTFLIDQFSFLEQFPGLLLYDFENVGENGRVFLDYDYQLFNCSKEEIANLSSEGLTGVEIYKTAMNWEESNALANLYDILFEKDLPVKAQSYI